MAMINCSECGNQVSDQALTCPHCGISSPISLEERNKREEKLRLIEEERIKKEEWEKSIEEELKKKKEIANQMRKKSNPILFAIAGGMTIIWYFAYSYFTPNIISNVSTPSGSTSSGSTANNSSYCYDMWYKYGSCVYRSSNGLPCKSGTDVSIPTECQNFAGKNEASKAGMLSSR